MGKLRKTLDFLGDGFKVAFSTISTRIESQKLEAEQLRRELRKATVNCMNSGRTTSSRIDTVLANERRQASLDRQNLVSQISSLINATTEAHDTRLTTALSSLRADVDVSTQKLAVAQATYNDRMDEWLDEEDEIVEYTQASKERVEGNLKGVHEV